MIHLNIGVDDLDTAVSWAESADHNGPLTDGTAIQKIGRPLSASRAHLLELMRSATGTILSPRTR
jgi:hypothetical protein